MAFTIPREFEFTSPLNAKRLTVPALHVSSPSRTWWRVVSFQMSERPQSTRYRLMERIWSVYIFYTVYIYAIPYTYSLLNGLNANLPSAVASGGARKH